jgi:serine/threonine protein kinase
MERGIDLSDWLSEPRSRPTILNMFNGVAAQLKQLHDAGYVHRDLKPQNCC